MLDARRDGIRTSAHIGEVFNLLWQVRIAPTRRLCVTRCRCEGVRKGRRRFVRMTAGYVVAEEACPTNRKDRRSISYPQARAEGRERLFPQTAAPSVTLSVARPWYSAKTKEASSSKLRAARECGGMPVSQRRACLSVTSWKSAVINHSQSALSPHCE